MDLHNNHEPPETSELYPWLRHTSWNNVPAANIPSAPGPIIYEGFVPQAGQLPPTYTSYPPPLAHENYQVHGFNAAASEPGNRPSDQNGNFYQYQGGPVQPYDTHVPQGHFTSHKQPNFQPASSSYEGVEDEGGMSADKDAQLDTARVISDIVTAEPGRTTVRGRGRGRPRGSGRGGRGARKEKQRGGWNKGTKTGLRPVLDPGEEFNVLHKEATEAFIEQQDFDKALELILKAISINPEIYSAHVLLSEVYFARNDDERGVAALFSGAHATPNDPAVWHQLADVCLQRSSLDRVTMLKQASYCFQRLLQIDNHDDDARFQKAAISRELGHHAKALKDFEQLLQRMPHNSSILRQIAEVCLEINDVGRAIGLYDDALEYQKLNGTEGEDAFDWADLIVYVDLIARSNGASRAIPTLKNIARQLVGREDETFWDEVTENDCEWDAEDVPRRVNVAHFKPDVYPVEQYGAGLPLELRVKLGDFRLKIGNREEAIRHFEWLAPDDHNEGSPLYEYSDLFLQVADALREIKEYEQALRYYEALYSINACDDVDFWLGLGACSYVCEKKEQALRCYEEAKAVDPLSGEARTQLSKLYAEKGERDRALLLARSAITIYESQIPRTDRRKYERKDLREAREFAQKAYKEAYNLPKPQTGGIDLPKPYFSRRARENTRRLAKEATRKAAAMEDQFELIQEVQEALRGPSLTPPIRQEGLRTREEAIKQMGKRKRSKKEKTVEDRYDNIRQLHSTLYNVTEAMRRGDDVARNVWMDCAEALVDEFRTERAFYPHERYMKFQGYDRPAQKGSQDTGPESRQDVQEDIPFPSVESTVPNEYCGIVFTAWLDIFLEYALLLANMQEDGTECYVVIRAALDCNLWYHDPQALFQIHTCWLTCALALRDEFTLFNTVLRWFMREFVFCTDTYRLFGALNLYFPHANDKGGKLAQMNVANFRSGPNQKYIFRQISTIDNQLPAGYGSEHPDGPVPEFMRRPRSEVMYISDRKRMGSQYDNSHADTGSIDLEDPQSPTSVPPASQGGEYAQRTFSPQELDVVLLTLYAQILYAGGSFPNALSYYYRAYTLEPKNPVVLLSIALCYMHQMLKRQNENRHMYLLQGWSFFEQYTDARMEWAQRKEAEGTKGLVVVARKEIEFNRARCWQMLGMSDLAIRSYGKMLDIKAVKVEDEMDVDDSGKTEELYSMEAAYAMMSMYAVNGDLDKAREITERYLVIE